MNKLSNKILAGISAIAVSLLPQISFAEEEITNADSVGGTAAGDTAAKAAIGGVSAGTIAAVVAIAAAAAAIAATAASVPRVIPPTAAVAAADPAAVPPAPEAPEPDEEPSEPLVESTISSSEIIVWGRIVIPKALIAANMSFVNLFFIFIYRQIMLGIFYFFS